MGKGNKSSNFCSSVKCQLLMLAVTVASVAVVVCIALLTDAVRTRQKMPPHLTWWQTTIIYQIYPRSFKDSDGDGIGDIKGIISKLDHFEYLNVHAIWISPVFKSPMKDFGYDISNFTDIDDLFGDLNDMTELIEQAHKKDIKVIMDFVPNHTSDQHPWFTRSLENDTKYRDFYVWSDQVTGQTPPNNWLSAFKGSSWEWSPKRGQFYYHQFLKEQPDLNYRNPDVVAEMKNVLRFWLNRGVDGFRIDALKYLFETTDLSLNEPSSNKTNVDPTEWDYLEHTYTMNMFDDIGEVLNGWREVLNAFEKQDNKTRFLIVESYTLNSEERKWWYTSAADMTFYFKLITDMNVDSSGYNISNIVNEGYKDLPANAWPNFVMGNHDNRRVATRKGARYVDALNMMLLTLRGTPTTYYGEEIGMLDSEPTYKQSVDPSGCAYNKSVFLAHSRDPERSPMQWSDTPQAGFSNSTNTWLPVGDYHDINVESEKKSKTPSSIKLYRTLAKLREEPSLKHGTMQNAVVNDNIFSYLRSAEDFPAYLVILNFGNETCVVDYTKDPVDAKSGVVVASTGMLEMSKRIPLDRFSLDPGEGVVVKITK